MGAEGLEKRPRVRIVSPRAAAPRRPAIITDLAMSFVTDILEPPVRGDVRAAILADTGEAELCPSLGGAGRLGQRSNK